MPLQVDRPQSEPTDFSMTSLTVEQFAKELAPLLKQQGFGKQRLQWRQDLGTTLAVLNVRVSAWGDRRDDVNVGIHLKPSCTSSLIRVPGTLANR